MLLARPAVLFFVERAMKRILLGAQKPGTLRFACAMDMITGEIVVN